MRTLFIVLGLIVVALIIGFLPRPILKPDWKAPYDTALAAGDCDTVVRLLEILPWLGFHEDVYENELVLKSKQICGYGPLTEDERKILDWRQKHPELSFQQTYWMNDWRTSLLGSRISEYRGRSRLKMSNIVRQGYLEGRAVLRACRPQYGPMAGGFPNYPLLSYALSWPDVSADVIVRIAREQQARCARILAATVAVMNAAAKTPDDKAAIASLMPGINIFFRSAAPDLTMMYGFNSIVLSEPDYQRARPGTILSEEDEVASDHFECFDDRLADQLLREAMDCVFLADLTMQEIREHDAGLPQRTDVYAVFYSNRAKRLGWRDVSGPEAEAKSRLSEDCYRAIIALEIESAGDATDPRDFNQLAWPVLTGQVCDPPAIVDQ